MSDLLKNNNKLYKFSIVVILVIFSCQDKKISLTDKKKNISKISVSLSLSKNENEISEIGAISFYQKWNFNRKKKQYLPIGKTVSFLEIKDKRFSVKQISEDVTFYNFEEDEYYYIPLDIIVSENPDEKSIAPNIIKEKDYIKVIGGSVRSFSEPFAIIFNTLQNKNDVITLKINLPKNIEKKFLEPNYFVEIKFDSSFLSEGEFLNECKVLKQL